MPEITPPDVAAVLAEAHALARRMCVPRARWSWLDDALDAADTAVARAARKYVPARGTFDAFAKTVVRRELRTLRRRRMVRDDRHAVGSAARPVGLPEESQDEAAADAPKARPEPADLPGELLAGLTPAQDEVVRMRVVLGMSFPEIGAARGTTRQAAFNTYTDAVARLRARLPSRG